MLFITDETAEKIKDIYGIVGIKNVSDFFVATIFRWMKEEFICNIKNVLFMQFNLKIKTS